MFTVLGCLAYRIRVVERGRQRGDVGGDTRERAGPFFFFFLFFFSCSSSQTWGRMGWRDHRRRIRRTRVAKVRTTEAAQFLRLAISEAQTVVTFAFPVAFERQLKNEPISSAQETRPPRFRPDVRILKCSFEATLLPMLLGGVHKRKCGI